MGKKSPAPLTPERKKRKEEKEKLSGRLVLTIEGGCIACATVSVYPFCRGCCTPSQTLQQHRLSPR
jgi:hypothetical protein